MSLSIPFPYWVAAEQKSGQVEVNISLALLHLVGIALHPRSFISDIAIFVLKTNVTTQKTLSSELCCIHPELVLVSNQKIICRDVAVLPFSF